MRRSHLVTILVLLLLRLTPAASAGEGAALHPGPACGPGWSMEGKPLFYDRDHLYERINGESELYMPYGFQLLTSARYARSSDAGSALEVDIYRMGSALDAFGIYANYRRQDDPDVAVGAEGTMGGSQLFFYQDRYFVRLQATGPGTPGRETLLACARAVSRNLPPAASPPAELEAILVPAVVRRSVRYVAESLLGYDFFRRGMVAEARVAGEEGELFLVVEDSPDRAGKALARYRAYLKEGGDAVRPAGEAGLEGVDPLYGRVVVAQSGRFLAGAVRFRDAAAARRLVEGLKARVSAR